MWWSWASVNRGPRLWPWSPASPKWVPRHSWSISSHWPTGWKQRTRRTMISAGGLSTTGSLQVCPTYSCYNTVLPQKHMYVSTPRSLYISHSQSQLFLNSFPERKVSQRHLFWCSALLQASSEINLLLLLFYRWHPAERIIKIRLMRSLEAE